MGQTKLRQGQLVNDGWVEAEETWTYASADDPTYTFTISGDKTSKYSAGMKIKLTQTTAKYFIITKVAYSSPNTTITVYGGTDYDLANATITSPYYSMVKAPQGFPLSPAKWSVVTSDTSNRQINPATEDTYYNMGSNSISVPIGSWILGYTGVPLVYGTGAVQVEGEITLSTANNSESDATLTCYIGFNDSASGTKWKGCSVRAEKYIEITSKTVYYLNMVFTSSASLRVLELHGDYGTTIIKATCAYL